MKPSRRTYRTLKGKRPLESFEVRVKETDLLIRTGRLLRKQAEELVYRFRGRIETYIESHPGFVTSLSPVEADPYAPKIVRDMIQAGGKVGVGPMAAVAGAIAEYVGRGLMVEDPDVMVENGGDVFIAASEAVTVGIFAGDSPLNLTLGILVNPDKTPIGVCASSGTIGHSLSLGRADAAVAVSRSTALADAAATSLGNRVSKPGDISRALKWIQEIEGILGAAVIMNDQLGVWGEVELVRLDEHR